ncbi:hypothetical protein BCR35DRAFT_214152 [Leucosporidium creatinivorum]|uniref:F-box domain-containing protein n=1 Tax=Leucosporidium creatinivorum TaxID=106004 RepID=A0A1Y2DAZ3_9BASI|nr:hypothetical protein BCR35DRAFT_214152 [Leucosporidium creatinivorum]
MLDRSFEADGIRMLGHLRSLKTLHGVLKSHIPPSPSAPILPPTFELLDFQTDYEIVDDVLHFVLHHSRSSLTRLELINAWWPFGEALDLSPYVALTSLSLCANGGWPICYADGNGGIMGTIKTCRNLTYLKLWGDESDEEPEDEEPFLHHLPPTLTTLVIDEIWAPYENLITDLAKDTVLPALRLLVLNNATQPYEEDSLVDGELPSWPTYNRLRGRMEQIESLCKRRSAEVSWTL